LLKTKELKPPKKTPSFPSAFIGSLFEQGRCSNRFLIKALGDDVKVVA